MDIQPYSRTRSYALLAASIGAGYITGEYDSQIQRARDLGTGLRRMYERLPKRQKVGHRKGEGTSKAATARTDRIVNTRALDLIPFVEITRATASDQDQPSLRERNVVYVSGVKFCIQVANLDDRPLRVHYAIVKRKDAITPTGTDFLGGLGSINRGVDLNTVGLVDGYLDCLPINTDEYIVFKHKKFVLNPRPGTVAANLAYVGNSTSGNYRRLEKYIKINRQFRFETSTDTEPIGQLYMVFWCYCVEMSELVSRPQKLQVECEKLVYFRDV